MQALSNFREKIRKFRKLTIFRQIKGIKGFLKITQANWKNLGTAKILGKIKQGQFHKN